MKIGIITTTEELLAPVRDAGRARPQVHGRDLFLAVLAASWAASSSSDEPAQDTRARMLTLLRTGWACGDPAD